MLAGLDHLPAMDQGGHGSLELIAALVLVIGGVGFITLSLLTRSGRRGPVASYGSFAEAATPSVGRSLVLVMAGLSFGAGVIHLVAAPSHYAEIGVLATGFVAAAAFQGLWAGWSLGGPSRRTMAIGLVGNIGLVGAWTWTRTIGLPAGALTGIAEPVGYPDVAATLFELLLIGGLVIRWFGLDAILSRRAVARTLASIAVVPVISLVMVLTSLATVAIASSPNHAMPADGHKMEHVADH